MLTNYQLKQYANKFLMETYGMKLSVPLEINGRLKKACGRFVWLKKDRQPKVVEMNKDFVENNEPQMVLDVLKHELVHYALFMKNIPHSDGDAPFERELRRLGIVSQNTINKYKIASKMQIYKCASCKKEHPMTRRLTNNGKNHRCKCGGGLIDIGKKVVAM